MTEIEWDTTCVLCDGRGTLSHGSGDEEQEAACVSCEGYGYNPTDAGHELIAFLKRRGLAFPMSPVAEDELRGMLE